MNGHRPLVIGVTGAMQSGKQELGPMWTRLGATFIDLNPYADCAREAHRAEYDALGLGDSLKPDGKETGDFYKTILANPHLHRATMEIELPYVIHEVRRVLDYHTRRSSMPIVLSWGYLYQLLPLGLTVDRMVLCRPDKDVWVRRIQNRAAEIGLTNLTTADVARMADILEMDPDKIDDAVVARYSNRYITRFDTSTDDWGGRRYEHLARIVLHQ